jgi:hypothetical protein
MVADKILIAQRLRELLEAQIAIDHRPRFMHPRVFEDMVDRRNGALAEYERVLGKRDD